MALDIVIPCATAARRLKGKGARCHIKLCSGETILERQINIFNKYFNEYKIHIILGFDFKKSSEKIKKIDNTINILYNENYETTNINSSIKLTTSHLEGNALIILHGDLVFAYNIFDKIKFNRSKIFIEKEKCAKNNAIGCIYDHEDILQHIGWNSPNKWTQIMFLTGKELDIFKKIPINNRGFSYEIISNINKKAGNFLVEKIEGGLIDIDTIKDLKIVNKIIK